VASKRLKFVVGMVGLKGSQAAPGFRQ